MYDQFFGWVIVPILAFVRTYYRIFLWRCAQCLIIWPVQFFLLIYNKSYKNYESFIKELEPFFEKIIKDAEIKSSNPFKSYLIPWLESFYVFITRLFIFLFFHFFLKDVIPFFFLGGWIKWIKRVSANWKEDVLFFYSLNVYSSKLLKGIFINVTMLLYSFITWFLIIS